MLVELQIMIQKKHFRLSLVFALGMTVTFTVLGVIASLAGKLIGRAASWWYIILGILMVLMALQTWEIYNFIPSTFLISKSTKKRLYWSIYCRYSWWHFFLTMLQHLSLIVSFGFSCCTRKTFMGNTASSVIFCRSTAY